MAAMRGAWNASLAAGIAMLIAVSGVAVARPEKPTRAEIKAARQHFAEAEEAKERGDYHAAATGYVAAYAILPDAEFLFDAGEMYRLAGDTAEAIDYFERYLARDPQGRAADEAHARLAELRAKQAAEAPAPGPGPAPAPPPVIPMVVATPADRPDSPGKTLRIAGLCTAGAGVLALGAGIYFGLEAQKISDEVSTWDTYMPDRVTDGEAAQRWAIAGTSVGVAALIGGGVLYYLGMKKDAPFQTELAQVGPLVTPSARGVQVAGRF